MTGTSILVGIKLKFGLRLHMCPYITLVNVYDDLLVFTRIAGTS